MRPVLYAVPRGASAILDIFKTYTMMVGGTVLLGSLLASQSLNTNIIVFLVALYNPSITPLAGNKVKTL